LILPAVTIALAAAAEASDPLLLAIPNAGFEGQSDRVVVPTACNTLNYVYQSNSLALPNSSSPMKKR
jgi:hypothetical protein